MQVKGLVKRCAAVAFVVAGWMSSLQAATLERLSMDDMIAKSTGIVRGTISDSWTEFTGRDIFTHYKIAVSERFKGPAQNTIEVTVHGGTYGNFHQTPAGSPVLSRGAEYVFFLWTSSAGKTWITGMTQGLFQIVGGETDPTVSRAASRELMLDGATGRPVKDDAVSFKMSVLRSRIASRLGQGDMK